MQQYLGMVKYVLDNGEIKDDRTGTGTVSIFGYQNRYDLRNGFPILTTKKIIFDSLKAELIWFLTGSTNINDLKNIYPTKIWDAWADKEGELGKIYGHQWRKWKSAYKISEYSDALREIDQIFDVINSIKNNPESRRHIVSAWNVGDIKFGQVGLPPCHAFFQFNVIDKFLDVQLYQRSADLALGVPFNITSYSLLLIMVANECNLIPRYFIHTFGDLHIYLNHIDGLKEQLKRIPKKLPKVKIVKKNIFKIEMNDIKLIGYKHDPFIKFKIAV